jgi:hypothetical protein
VAGIPRMKRNTIRALVKLVCLMLMTAVAFAVHAATVSGTATGASGGQPVAAATVILDRYTDIDGFIDQLQRAGFETAH